MSLRKKRIDKIRNVRSKRASGGVILAPVDGTLLIIIAFLCMFGLMAVFSAGAPEGTQLHNNPSHYAIRQMMFLCIGTFAMFYVAGIDYKKWKKYAIPFAIISLALVIATYIPGLGETKNGSTRWLSFLPVQPSEFAKLASIILAASALSEAKSLLDKKIMLNFGIIGISVLFIFIQPNLSVSLLILATTAAMMITGGVSVFLLLGAVSAFIPVLISKMHGYQMKRITSWLNPWEDPQGAGYNLIQSLYAIAGGGLLGVGFGNSKQKLFWLPERHTDFIFSVIAEELGFIGCLLLIGLFVSFIHRGFWISNRCDDLFVPMPASLT